MESLEWGFAFSPSLLGTCVGITPPVSFGPWAFNRKHSFIKSQIDSALNKTVEVHYHQLDIRDSAEDISSEDAERAGVGLQFSTLAAEMEPSWFHKCGNDNEGWGDLQIL